MIRLYKIKAMLYRDVRTLVRSKERLIDFLFFPVTNTLLWGLFAIYMGATSPETAMMLLMINIFWAFTYLSQSSANLQINMDVWSSSLNQLLISGINEIEYLIARFLYSGAASALIMILMGWMVGQFGLVLPPIHKLAYLVFVTYLASVVLGTLVVSLYVMLGKSYAFLSWSVMQLIIMLSAPFFPIDIYPRIIQKISKALPHTWLFESLREFIRSGTLNMGLVNKSLFLSVIYLILVIPFYLYVFKKSRKNGALVRLGF